MANDLNCCIFTGRLGQDPEVRFLPSGQPVANLNLAVGKQWKDKNTGAKQEATSWPRCVAFGKTAELAQQYLSKGSQVRVTCELRENKWQDQEGKNRSSMEFIIREMQFLGGGQQGGGQQGGYGAPPQGQGRPPQQGGQQQGYQQQPPPQQQGQQPPPQQQRQAPPQGGASQGGPQQGGNYGAPDPGSFDDFDDEIPF